MERLAAYANMLNFLCAYGDPANNQHSGTIVCISVKVWSRNSKICISINIPSRVLLATSQSFWVFNTIFQYVKHVKTKLLKTSVFSVDHNLCNDCNLIVHKQNVATSNRYMTR